MKNQVNEEQNPSSIEHGGERQSVAFTPGPWKASGNGVHKGIHCVAVAHAPDAKPMEIGVKANANARLIAAAPDLYAALKAMLYIFDRGLPETSIGRKTCDEARAALELVTPK